MCQQRACGLKCVLHVVCYVHGVPSQDLPEHRERDGERVTARKNATISQRAPCRQGHRSTFQEEGVSMEKKEKKEKQKKRKRNGEGKQGSNASIVSPLVLSGL